MTFNSYTTIIVDTSLNIHDSNYYIFVYSYKIQFSIIVFLGKTW